MSRHHIYIIYTTTVHKILGKEETTVADGGTVLARTGFGPMYSTVRLCLLNFFAFYCTVQVIQNLQTACIIRPSYCCRPLISV
jgi:hypothetical protein